jgi:hypothetical protein
VRPPDQRLDEAKLFASRVEWTVDPDDFSWLRASFRGSEVFLRINVAFPDEPLYSLLVDVAETVDFDDLPPQWTIVSPLEWPDDARGQRR